MVYNKGGNIMTKVKELCSKYFGLTLMFAIDIIMLIVLWVSRLEVL